ncbi:MAG TPA: C45 family peptidase [Bryobacteraceae bacterium]|nr:C45 family peptidase [Bryobacteraceae bacterium]
MRRIACLAAGLLLGMACLSFSTNSLSDARLKHASRAPARNGWIYVHLEGTPAEIGFQHGSLLAHEIEDNLLVTKTELEHDEGKTWDFFRQSARDVFWPHIEPEYRQELRGIADGLKAQGVKADLWDVLALNASMEQPYYDRWLRRGKPNVTGTADRCSAFVATGSYTRDGRIVIGHNAWSSYASGERWNVIFDIVPAKGYHILMDGTPGVIDSGDDWGVNSAGLVITETTISAFAGFNPNGVPEFVRARKAMQYAGSIAQFANIMEAGNNGGYANTWLVADSRTNEIASLELGLQHVTLNRTKDGYYVGSNFAANPDLIREETTFDPANPASSQNARHLRWKQLMAEDRGRIDVTLGKQMLADHFDAFENKIDPDERTLCGHVDLSPRGMGNWEPQFGPAGTVQAKVTDAAGAKKMTFSAALGHPCGLNFRGSEFLTLHPEFEWTAEILRDMDSQPWTIFAVR